MIRLIGYALLIYVLALAVTHADSGAHKLTWVTVVQHELGIAVIKTPVAAPEFTDKASCERFGNERRERHADWVRGYLQAPLDFDGITVGFECEPAGQPT